MLLSVTQKTTLLNMYYVLTNNTWHSQLNKLQTPITVESIALSLHGFKMWKNVLIPVIFGDMRSCYEKYES